jgi:hypothetical protein
VFTVDEVELDLDFPAAVSRLALLLRGDWLDSVSQDAYAEGLTGRVRVGPLGGVRSVSKRVEVSLLEPVRRDDMVVMPLRWEATGLMGRLFPVLDANLILRRNECNRAVLRLTGVYRPPLASVGEELDQIVLHRVAAATVKSLLTRIATLFAEMRGEAAET